MVWMGRAHRSAPDRALHERNPQGEVDDVDPLRQNCDRPTKVGFPADRRVRQESMVRALHHYERQLGRLETVDLETALADLASEPPTLAQTLQSLLREKGLKRARVVAEARINPTFGYQIFVGQRRASRNKLLALCIAMELDLSQANALLRSGGVNELHIGTRRDAIVAYGLLHHYPFQRVQEELYRFGESMLG